MDFTGTWYRGQKYIETVQKDTYSTHNGCLQTLGGREVNKSKIIVVLKLKPAEFRLDIDKSVTPLHHVCGVYGPVLLKAQYWHIVL